MFVNFYYDFKDFSIPKDELAKRILSINPGSKLNSQNSRISRARHIFEVGQELDTLRIIIESKRISSEVIEKAKSILTKEKMDECFQIERVENDNLLRNLIQKFDMIILRKKHQ